MTTSTPRPRGGSFQRLPDEPDSFTEWWEGGAHKNSRGARSEALAAWEAAAAAERERNEALLWGALEALEATPEWAWHDDVITALRERLVRKT